MKRILSLFLCAVMMLFFGITASAAGLATMDFTLTGKVISPQEGTASSDLTVQTGDIIEVTYTLTPGASSEIIATQNEIYYNKNFFELVEGSNTVVAANYKTSVVGGGRRYVYFNTMIKATYAAEPLVVGTFQLKVIATEGESTVSNTSYGAKDSNNVAYPTTVTNLHVSIGAPQVQKYNVEFLNDDGTSYETFEVEAGQSVTIPAGPAKDKHSFTYWSLSGDTTQYLPGQTYTPSSDVSFRPNWNRIITYYTLKYESNGGTTYSDETYEEGTTVSLTKTPSKTDYTFEGWCSDEALNNPVTSVTMNADTTVYAKWAEVTKPTPTPKPPRPSRPTPKPPVEDPECSRDNTCPAAKFTDLNLDLWYHDGIHYCVEHNLMNGNTATTFNPDGTTTRGQIVAILYRQEGSPAVSGSCTFSDVKANTYYEKAVIWAAANGIVTGYDDGTFHPDAKITRQQLAAILYRYANYKGYAIKGSTNISGYADDGSVSAYAVEPMKWAVGNGLITGYTNNTLGPGGNAKRSQVATILMRFCMNIAD